MPVQPITAEKCRRQVEANALTFATTAELEPHDDIIGQTRGTTAIAFGMGIKSHGYNIYILGATGTGRATAIKRFLQRESRETAPPSDWIYVHNFVTPHQPRAIALHAGEGLQFQKRMARLIKELRQDLPTAFESETYREKIDQVQAAFEELQGERLREFQQKAVAAGFALLRTASGFALAPSRNDAQLTPQDIEALSLTERQALEAAHEELSGELNAVLYKLHQKEVETRQEMKKLDREVAATAVQHHFEDMRGEFAHHAEALEYLDEVHQDVLDQIEDFAPPVDNENAQEIDLRRYEVNLLVDNGQTEGAPVIASDNPTYHNLFGRIEYEMQAGYLSTHFTNIKCGALHWANGGYLILNAHDLLKNPLSWEALKRALNNAEIFVQPSAQFDQAQVMAKSLDPEPIPLDIKIILVGSVGVYYALYEQDEDFRTLFKVRADFDSQMPRETENEMAYAHFIAGRCREEKLRHFDRQAVAKIIELGARLADHQHKLSTRFGVISDLIREASYWAEVNGRATTSAADVQQALEERRHRANRAEELTLEHILDGTIFIATEDAIVGQVNGLSVLDTGDYSFGQPGRITARTFMGDDGIIHIERETEMSGPIHEKGVLTLTGYLGGTYAQHQPLSLTASITFEQTYSGVDGDSASSTELYALLSSLSEIPIKQGIAVTGSVNQRGEIQPIGAVNEKIEGFFRLCQERGLTGNQGVLIPASNLPNLMLAEEVVDAVATGQFHIWPVARINEGIELLTGIPAGEKDADGDYPAGTIHFAVQERLQQLAEDLSHFGDDDE